MVFFTCSACGASLKKNQVDKHCNTKCRHCEYLTCIDCLKDFPGDSYKSHTKCMTEDERYGGKNYVPKVNKNENKQLEWVENIHNLLTSSPDMDPDIKDLLHTIMSYENIPRKKAKFINFMKNVNKRVHPKTVDKTWEFFEKALRTTKPSNEQNNGTSDVKKKNEEEASPNTESSKKDSKKKEDKKKKKKSDLEEISNESSKEDKREKKKKKRDEKDESDSEDEAEEPSRKIHNTFLPAFQGSDLHKSSKKRKCEEIIEEDEDSPPKKVGKFDWEGTITALLKKKDGSISLKKLKKKVLAEYESQCGVTHKTQEDLLSKMNKKISKNKKFKVQKDQVILVS